MHKSATKCNETLGKWCKNNHGASKIIDTLETYQACARFFRAKAQGFRANDGDAYGCHDPFEGAVVVTFAMLGLRVKTLDLAVSTSAACASLPSWERRHGAPIPLLVLVTSVTSFGSSCTFLLSLICFVRGYPHHLVSVRPFVLYL
jgi:hypothetical protein